MRSFVLDTNALLPIMFSVNDLTRLGRALVESAQDYQAELVVPAVSLVEANLEMRTGWRRHQIPFEQLMAAILERDYMRIEPLGTDQLAVLPTLRNIPEMLDQLIAAHAITNDAPLMTRDRAIRDSGLIECIW